MTDKPVFFDASGRRASRMSWFGRAAAVLTTVIAIVFIASLFAEPHVAQPNLPGRLTPINPAELVRRAFDPAMMNAAAKLAQEARTERAKLVRAWRAQRAKVAHAHLTPTALRPFPNRPLTVGFYLSTDELSYPDLKRDLSKLDWFVPAWMNLEGPGLKLAHNVDRKAVAAIAHGKPNVAILPLVQNASNAVWDGPGMAALLADPLRRRILLEGIVSFLAANKFHGAVVDFESLPQSAYPDLVSFLREMKAAFAPHGWLVVVASPFDDDSWPYAQCAGIVDYTLLMAYDEHDDSAGPGSIAGQAWYEENLDKRMAVLSPSRTIIGIGNYGYDWSDGSADPISFQDAIVASRDSQAKILFDDATNNPHFSYLEDDNSKHQVWFLDGVTAYNEIHAADPYQPAGYALWKLGSEDPSTWTVLGRRYGATAPAGLRDIPTSQDVDFEGAGEILQVEAHPTPGTRFLDIDKDTGDVDDESYTKLPTPYVVRQLGARDDKELALTFDDGPDPTWTPQILDILKAEHVKATFFVIGENAEAYPELVQRIVAEGHDVGNHTFTHPNLSDTPGAAVELELNATQRLFQALTGRSLRLFRPPYLGDAEPSDESDLQPVEVAQDLGYITVGMHVDPVDWELPGVKAILQRTLAAVHSKNPDIRGNIILFHDAGGDRSQTVAALPKVIDTLRAQGYRFVSVAHLAGLSRAQAMPRLPVTATLVMDRLVFLTLSWTGLILYYCFLAAIFLGIARLVVWCALALWNRPRETGQSAPPLSGFSRTVSVIIPAFNEEKVIAATVERILSSDHPHLEIVVIDDGSLDDTAGIVTRSFGTDPRVQLLRIANGGKANALNLGLANARGEVVVALDADTQFDTDTISRLVRWFDDARVGAVAGNAKVGNRINMITRWQALEYIVSQNLERRALAALDTLTVVPGAVGAWRRSVLEELGGFTASTLAEDQDLTIAVQRAGYRVLFDASAIAWTEAPATVRGFAKQRFRWAFGTLQCLWKYRALTFNPRYGALGLVALPQAWMFQILLTALAPIADLMLIWQLLSQWIAYLEHGSEFSNTNLVTVAVYYGVFMVVDLLAALFGFCMERREDWNLTWWLTLQRFGYRQIMYYVLVRSISTALRGRFVGWSKLERTGTVKVTYPRKLPAH